MPEVPSETTTSPLSAPSPSAAAMLSPVPAASFIPSLVSPTIAFGSAISGTDKSLEKANLRISFLYLFSEAEK